MKCMGTEEGGEGERGCHDDGVKIEPPYPINIWKGVKGGTYDRGFGPVGTWRMRDGKGGDIGPDKIIASQGKFSAVLYFGDPRTCLLTMSVTVRCMVAEGVMFEVWEGADSTLVVAGKYQHHIGIFMMEISG